MNQKKVIPTWLNVLCLVLIVGCLVWTVYGMLNIAVPEIDSETVNSEIILVELKLLDFTTILALIAALIYCLLGYRKKASPFFKIFLYLFMLHTFAYAIAINPPYFVQCICVIQFGLICALSLSINLGKTRSYVYTLLFMACAIAKIIKLSIVPSAYGSVSELILIMIFGIMVYAKYQDKAARGTN